MGKPKPVTRKEQQSRRVKKAHGDLLAIAQKAKIATQKRNAVQKGLADNGELITMIHNDDKGLHKENHPFINSYEDRLKGVGPSPMYTVDDVQKKINTGPRIGMTLNQPGQVEVRGEIPNKFKRNKSRRTHKKMKPKRKKRTVEPLSMTLRSRSKSMEPSALTPEPLKKKLVPVRRYTRVKTGVQNVPTL